MKIFLASDHAGFQLKNEIKEYLISLEHSVTDFGPKEYDHDDDYPDYISLVASEISKSNHALGIVFGWSGQGEAMVANRFKNVRCALYYGGNKHILTLSREHNNANVLSVGSHFVTTQEAKEAVSLWLGTKFSEEERHTRRIKKIDNLNN
ncbi:MAG: RpiB/LacA/LacB family sugar-phosphate isomerase [Patescibacteria group bacterium]